MSLGYIGKCKLLFEDDDKVIYAYSGENWNDGGKSNSGDADLLDGSFTIYKHCLEEPEIHTKIAKSKAGRKKTVMKRIMHMPSIQQHILEGNIMINKPCKNEFARGSVITYYLAHQLLIHIFIKYQEHGKMPVDGVFVQ